MERRRDRQQQRAFGASILGHGHGTFHCGFVARQYVLAGVVFIGDLTDLAFGGGFGQFLGLFNAKAKDRRHGTLAHWDSRLHRLAANAQQPCGVGKRQRPCGAKRGIFAKTMARHKGRFANLDPFGLQRGHRRHRRGHQRRLGVLCEGQPLDVPLPDQVRQFFAKGVIDFLENGAGFRIGFGQIAAHADGLGTLARENECNAHGCGLSYAFCLMYPLRPSRTSLAAGAWGLPCGANRVYGRFLAKHMNRADSRGGAARMNAPPMKCALI